MEISRSLGRFSYGCALWAVMAAAAPAVAQQRNFNVPAEDARRSIPEFARQAGVQISAPTGQLRGVKTRAIQGAIDARAALKAMLSGTGLSIASDDGNLIVLHYGALSEATPLPAASSATDPVDVATAAGSNEGADIVVTAQKRQERLIDTPQSVSVLTGQTLNRLAATQFRDFANTVPGLTFTTQGAGNTQVSLRGVTAGVDSSATVGIYVDDVPYGSSTPFALGGRFALDVGLFDIDRIEVLRGPQGTLYGASTMGGLLKYVTTQPDTNRFSGDIKAGVSSTEGGGTNYNVSVVANVPVATDKVALRVSGFQSHDGGYINNVGTGERDVNRSNVYGGRADLLLKPTEDLSIRLVAFAQNIRRDGEATADYDLASGKPLYGSLGQNRPYGEPFSQDFRLFSGTLNYDFGGTTLTSVSSYQTTRTHWNADVTYQYAPLLLALLDRTYSSLADVVLLSNNKFTQEVRLSSKSGSKIEWIIGGFYTHERSHDNEHFGLTDTSGQPAVNDLFTYAGASTYNEIAGFGDLTWHITPKLSLGGGIRYSHTKSEFEQVGGGLLGLSAPATSQSDNVATYLGNLSYRFSSHATAYLRYATGYRPGGPAIVTAADPTARPTFDPDRLSSYEAGFKAETSDRTFGIDLAGYHIDWDHIQLFTVNAGGFGTFVNATGGAKIDGGELTLTARPTTGFIVVGAFAYQHARLSDNEPLLGGRKGETLPNVPKFTAALNADYTLPIGGDLRPSVGAGLRFVSKRESSFDASKRFPQHDLPDYTSVDLRAGISFGQVDAQLFVHNLFNERGQLSAFTQFGTARVGLIQPRTVGVSATAHF